MNFEFDPAKSEGNRGKHGIDFEQAQSLWLDDRLLRIEAHEGVDGETRRLVIGRIAGRHWSAVVTMRGAATRLISVRRSRPEEVELYDREEL